MRRALFTRVCGEPHHLLPRHMHSRPSEWLTGLESGTIILVRAVAIEYNETSAISIEFAIRGNIDALAGVG
jgi:hypothetical protein